MKDENPQGCIHAIIYLICEILDFKGPNHSINYIY